jgi:probable HAF family extracellular repeat protein
MALWNQWNRIIRPRGIPLGSRRTRAHGRPPRRLCLEALEDRCLLSSYAITDLGTIATDQTSVAADRVTLNNASVVQVVGQNPSDHAYLWDGVHGMQDLGTVGHDAESAAMGINDSGQVVGLSYTETLKVDKHNPYGSSYYVETSLHAFLATSAGGMQNIGTNDIASGINRSGEVVGTLNNNQQAALWSGGHWTGLGTLGGSASDGFGINDNGQAVGMSYIASPPGYDTAHAFLWTPTTAGATNGRMSDLGALNSTPGDDNSIAFAVNGQGVVTGYSEIAVSLWYHAFVWTPSSPNGTNGTMIDLGALDAYSYGYGINSGGTVVGTSDYGPGGWHAVIWQKGSNGYTIADLNSLIPTGSGWVLTGANAINDSGAIVGTGVVNGQTHAFLLTPTATTTALAQPARSTPSGTLAGPISVPGSDPSVAPVPASSPAGSSSFGLTGAAVSLWLSQPAAAPAGAASPAVPFAEALPLVPPPTGSRPPADQADSFQPAVAPEAVAADPVVAGLDAETSSAPFVDDLALTGRRSEGRTPAPAQR